MRVPLWPSYFAMIRSGPLFRAFPTAVVDLNHSSTSDCSLWWSIICSASSFGVAGLSDSLVRRLMAACCKNIHDLSSALSERKAG